MRVQCRAGRANIARCQRSLARQRSSFAARHCPSRTRVGVCRISATPRNLLASRPFPVNPFLGRLGRPLAPAWVVGAVQPRQGFAFRPRVRLKGPCSVHIPARPIYRARGDRGSAESPNPAHERRGRYSGIGHGCRSALGCRAQLATSGTDARAPGVAHRRGNALAHQAVAKGRNGLK
jgi:hypothetical protein